MYINGNGFSISGDKSNKIRIFHVKNTAFFTLDNVILKDGKASEGGAIYVEELTSLATRNTQFINNTAVYRGGAIYSKGNVTITNTTLDGNDISITYAANCGGAAVYSDGGILTITNSNITNNMKNIQPRQDDEGDKVYGAVTTSGETLIAGSYFADNGGCWGGAVSSIGPSTGFNNITIKETTFERNRAYQGGAIYIDKSFVDISNCAFKDNEGMGKIEDVKNEGGAIFAAVGLVNITGSTFTTNFAVTGGAISLEAIDAVAIDNCIFTGNSATDGGAIYSPVALKVSNSEFTDNTAQNGNAILNDGILYLSNNTISTTSADIVDNGGNILSEINVVILNGDPSDPITFNGEVLLTAKITDDNGNLIDDKKFKFVVNETELDAVFNKISGLYEADYFNPVPGIYDVNMTYDYENLVVKTAKLRNIRSTFTDLAERINGNISVELPYDFAYVEEIDGDAFREGIVINEIKQIKGNGYTIDAKNSNRIFNVNTTSMMEIFTLTNVTLTNGAADKGAAIYNSGWAFIQNVNFINNTAVNKGGAIYSQRLLYLSDSTFDGNDISQLDVAGNGGAAIFNTDVLSIKNITVTNNHKDRSFDDYVSGAIATSGKTIIENSYFANNTGCYGGAVMATASADLEIINSTFAENQAVYGGAVLDLSSSELTINNCTFEHNNAVYGGAVAAYLESKVTIKDSTFTINTAVYGGAVSLVYMVESDVENCTFTGNIANDGGALFILAEVNVKDSVFTDNWANYKGRAIYNNGTLSLSNNTISTTSADIYNDELGEITSKVYATFIDGQTVTVNMGDTVILNATFVDDMGNAIYDAKFRFNITGDGVIENITYDNETTVYSVEYYVATAGLKEISSNLEYPKINVVKGYLDVPKANVTLDIFAEDIVEGENATIIVHVYGVKGTEMNATVFVLVNNTLYEVNVTNSYGNLTVSGLEAGSQAIFVNFKEDANYNENYNSSTFYVKFVTNLNVTVNPTYDYGDDVTIRLELYDSHGNPVTDVVNLTVGGESYNVLINNGVGYQELYRLVNGTYTITTVYAGNTHLNGTVNVTSFKVKKLTDFNVTIIGTYPEAMVVINGQNGVYNVYIDDEHDFNITVENYVPGIEFINLAAGNYQAVVMYMTESDEYSNTYEFVNFIVEKAKPEMAVNITDNIEVGQSGVQINVTLAENATGTLIVKIDGKAIGEYSVDGPETIIEIGSGNLTEGPHSYEVIYSGDGNYTGDEFAGTFSAKYYTDLTVTVDPAVYNYGEPVEVILTLTENQGKLLTTTVNVTINGKSQTVLIEDGKATLTLTDLESGEYTVTAVLDETIIYNGSVSNEAKFTVKTVPEFTVFVSGQYPFAIALISGQPGNYTIYIDDEHSVDRNITGFDIEEFFNLAAGEYNLTVIFNGNDTYSTLTKVVPFTVLQADPAMEVSITDYIEVDQEGVQITVTMADNVTGTVSIDIDGQPMTIGGSASSSFTVNVPSKFLTAGNHTFVVRYSGDRNYTPDSVPHTFTVHKITPTVSVTVDKEGLGVMGASNVTVYVADDATGRVIIDYNGEETIIAKLGEAGNFTFDIYDLEAGEYYVNVTYEGDDKYNEAYGHLEFTIPKANATPVISEVTENILGGEDVTFTVEMSNDFATGNLTIFVDGVPTLTVEISEDGPTPVSVPGLGNGTHTIGVKYNGDDNFNESDIVNFTVSVTKANSTVTINIPVNETFDDHMTIEFTVVNQTELIFIVVDQNGTGYMGEIIDGKYVLTGLPVGNYTVNVTNIESDMFNPSSANATFAILKFDFVVDFPVNTSSTEISITTPADAGGLLLVDIDGQQHYAPVENGTATVVIPKLAPGNYTATISYTGDGKYGNQTTTKEVSIPSNLPENAIDIPTYSETNSPTFTINLPSDAKGTFSVVVDGKEYGAILQNGTASITVPNLASGDYKVGVTYSGDDKYSSYAGESLLTIHIPVYKLDKNKDINVLYSASKSYSVRLTKDGKVLAGEQVTITFNGKTYKVKTDSKGYATLKLNTKVKVNTYTITAECKGVKVSNTVKVKNIIKIKNIKTKKSKKVIKIKATLKKVNGKYLKGKKLKLKVKGMTFKAKTNKKGKAVFKLKRKAIKKLSKTKKYTYTVTNNMKVTVKKPKHVYKVYYGKDVAQKTITLK